MRLEVIPGLKYKRWLRVFLWRFDLKRKFTGICSFQAMPEMDFRPRGKGRKLAWQGACSEKTKGAAQLRAFFVNVDERVWSWDMLARWTSRPTYWGDVCWRGRGWEHMIIMYCCTKRMKKFSISNMMTRDWGRFKGPPSAAEWTFASAGRSNAVQNRSWGWEVGARAQHENEARLRWRLPMNEHANQERRCINDLKRNEAYDANHAEDADAACEPTRGVVNWEVSRNCRFQAPPQYLAKARGTSASRS